MSSMLTASYTTRVQRTKAGLKTLHAHGAMDL